MSSELLCKDCKHSFRTFSTILVHGFKSEYAYQCKKSFKETHVEPNPVVGSKKVEAKYESCGVTRIGGSDRCGESGKWWEPKNKKFIFLQIKHSEKNL